MQAVSLQAVRKQIAGGSAGQFGEDFSILSNSPSHLLVNLRGHALGLLQRLDEGHVFSDVPLGGAQLVQQIVLQLLQLDRELQEGSTRLDESSLTCSKWDSKQRQDPTEKGAPSLPPAPFNGP